MVHRNASLMDKLALLREKYLLVPGNKHVGSKNERLILNKQLAANDRPLKTKKRAVLASFFHVADLH